MSIFLKLQRCVAHIIRAQGNFRERMTKATDPLVGLLAEDFPKRLRGRATAVLGVRGAVAQKYETDTLFHFELLRPRERQALIEDIIALYEGCLIDIGRLGDNYDNLYPEDRHRPVNPSGGLRPRQGVSTLHSSAAHVAFERIKTLGPCNV